MRETEDVAARRKANMEMKDLLRRALDIVNEVSLKSSPLVCNLNYFSLII